MDDQPLTKAQRKTLAKQQWLEAARAKRERRERRIGAQQAASKHPMAGRIKAAKRAAARATRVGQPPAKTVRGGLPGLGKKR